LQWILGIHCFISSSLCSSDATWHSLFITITLPSV